MKISIIILSYNDYTGTTGPCLASLSSDPAFKNWEIIVIDNASNEETKASLQADQSQYPSVRFVFNEKNIGYAAGNNVGIRLSTGDVVILLNSDTQAPVGMIDKLAACFINNPQLGMAGPVTNSAGNEQAIFTSAASIEGEIQQGLRYANSGGNELLITYRLDFHCVAISRAVINKVGLLDEDFGRGYYEDFDYSLRVKQAGFYLRMAENVFIYHRGSASFKKLPTETKYLMKHNKKRIIKKHGSQVSIPHLRDGNLAILAQYAELKRSGVNISDYRTQSRVEFALKNQPRSFFKKWRYLRLVRKTLSNLGFEINL